MFAPFRFWEKKLDHCTVSRAWKNASNAPDKEPSWGLFGEELIIILKCFFFLWQQICTNCWIFSSRTFSFLQSVQVQANLHLLGLDLLENHISGVYGVLNLKPRPTSRIQTWDRYSSTVVPFLLYFCTTWPQGPAKGANPLRKQTKNAKLIDKLCFWWKKNWIAFFFWNPRFRNIKAQGPILKSSTVKSAREWRGLSS